MEPQTTELPVTLGGTIAIRHRGASPDVRFVEAAVYRAIGPKGGVASGQAMVTPVITEPEEGSDIFRSGFAVMMHALVRLRGPVPFERVPDEVLRRVVQTVADAIALSFSTVDAVETVAVGIADEQDRFQGRARVDRTKDTR
jgi:hypothetical protein